MANEVTPETTEQLVSRMLDCATVLRERFGEGTLVGIWAGQIVFYGELMMDEIAVMKNQEAA